MRNAESRIADSTRGAGLGGVLPGGQLANGLRCLLLFVAILSTLFVFVAGAEAERGIVGYHQLQRFTACQNYCPQEEPNFFLQAGAIAVNGEGSGNAGPGDLYVMDIGGGFQEQAQESRLQQFSDHHSFIRLWGSNVVLSGPGNADETQSATVRATGGDFTLTFSGQTTGAIPYNAPPSGPGSVQAALNALSSIGGAGGSVAVSGGPGNASGSAPYLIDFGGSLANVNQPQVSADDSDLSGSEANVFVATINRGGNGFEICEPVNGDFCQKAGGGEERGALGSSASVAVNQTNGDVYAAGNNRVNQYSASGDFIRAFGFDVVRSGPSDSSANEQQELTVAASGGTFSLTLFLSSGGSTTAGIPYNATASQVEGAIDSMSNLAAAGGDVSVSGGPGDTTGSSPYLITFGGSLGGDGVDSLGVSGENLVGIPRSAGVTTAVNGGASEVCGLSDVCQKGSGSTDLGGALFSENHPGLAIAPAGAPNAGNVLVPDQAKRRVSEFSATGAFIRVFGRDVDADDPLTGFEVCSAASGHDCKAGASGRGSQLGQFLYPLGISEDSTGSIYVAEGPSSGFVPTGNFRVQKFTQAGTDLIPSLFGTDEVQEIAVKAAAGQFRLGAIESGGTKAIGDIVAGAMTITDVQNVVGEFAVGQPIFATQVPVGTTITAVGPTTISISKPIRFGCGVCAFTSNRLWTTADLQSSATSGEVEDALNALPGVTHDLARGTGDVAAGSTTVTNVATAYGAFSVGSGIGGPGITPETTIVGTGVDSITLSEPADATNVGAQLRAFQGTAGPGLVSVTGGPGDAGGTSPYVITYDGGLLEHTDPNELIGLSGTTPLSGGSGPGANEAIVGTSVPGGPSGTEAGGYGGTSRFPAPDSPLGVAVGPDDEVVVLRSYRGGPPICEEPGTFEPAEARLQVLTPIGTVTETSKPCLVDPNPSLFITESTLSDVPDGGLAINPATGAAFVVNDKRVLVFGDPGTAPDLALDPPSKLSAEGVVVSGTVDPNGPGVVNHPNPSKTTYRVDFRKVGATSWTSYASDTGIGTGFDPTPFSVGVTGLEPKTEYEVRVIVTKPFGFKKEIQVSAPFITLAAPPTVDSFTASGISASAADLHAAINPRGTETSYHFEYGPTLAYGQSTPERNIGDSLGPVTVQDHIEGLEGVVYHFRVVATNVEGVTVSHNQTFNFYPEPCPNATARQQTGSGGLPDCRAYEIVSPEDAGSALIGLGGPNSPYASSPSRYSFAAGFGRVPGPWNPPNLFEDAFITTRTATGWKTAYAGLPADKFYGGGAPPAQSDLGLMTDLGADRMLIFRGDQASFGSIAPYVENASGQIIDRWPTNLAQVPAGDNDIFDGGPVGYPRPSPDFSHFFFSTANMAFAPGGLTSEGGSVYDNDVAAGTVVVASKLPSGGDIPREPGNVSNDYMQLPAASVDGSHILMAVGGTGLCGGPSCGAAPAVCAPSGINPQLKTCPREIPSHLYMRVDGSVTYDVSKGHVVDFEGMTNDGATVYFKSVEPLTGDDHDTSTDLFMWSEITDSLTRISVGLGLIGDVDACNATWVVRCGVEVVPDTNGPGPSKTDNSMAPGSGAIYFYSPEQFVGTKGIPGRRNLYVYRGGQTQYVTTLDADNEATRIQVSRDGKYAAFITATKLTGYDNAGYEEMYSYDAESEKVLCVSCDPDGDPPQHDVEGSQKGIFMADDGRTFFAIEDPLVPLDTNGGNDVYEYVAGKARLISSGVAETDQAPAGQTGLGGVSANGADVYFSTVDSLVAQDKNGDLILKVYDARTNGGFSIAAAVAPCAAADECHGAGSAAPVPSRVVSTANFGDSGRGTPARKQSRKKRCKARAKRTSKSAATAHRKSKRCRTARHRAGTDRKAGK